MKVNSKKILLELERLGWTHQKLADEVGFTKQALSILLLRETAPLSTLTKIGEVLCVDPKELLI